MSLTLDTNNFVSALLFVEKETGRDCATSLNRGSLHTIIGSGTGQGAMQLTKKASKASIELVSDAALRKFVIFKAKKKGTWFQMTGKDVQAAVRRERARRKRAIGYTAYAGWDKAARAVGGRGVGKGVNADFAKSFAAQGSGKKATSLNLEAVIVNTTPMAEILGFVPLQMGLDNAAKDLVEFAHARMQKTMNQVKVH